jgi:hypothetical protein
MDRLLGHLAQLGSFWQQGELLCTQGLAYLLRNAEGERAFTDLIGQAAGRSLSPGLSWQAECVQDDRGRPDLEGRDEQGQAVVKVEAKLEAPFGQGQLESYVSALCAGGQGGILLVLVPRYRLKEIAGYLDAHPVTTGAGPLRFVHEGAEVPCAIVTWEDVLDALSAVDSEGFRDDLDQFHAMYRVLNGGDMEPITSDEQVLDWRNHQAWWEMLVEHVTRTLSPSEGRILPFGVDGGARDPYRRRYVCRRVSGDWSCYSVGTKDPFKGHMTPVWLRFHKGTGHFAEIADRLDRSEIAAMSVRSQRHLWFPLDVPKNSDRQEMTAALVAQVQRITGLAYPPAASEEQ